MRIIFVLAIMLFFKWHCWFKYFISKVFCCCEKSERLLTADFRILKIEGLKETLIIYVLSHLASPSPQACCSRPSCIKWTTRPRGWAVSRCGSACPPGYWHHVPKVKFNQLVDFINLNIPLYPFWLSIHCQQILASILESRKAWVWLPGLWSHQNTLQGYLWYLRYTLHILNCS